MKLINRTPVDGTDPVIFMGHRPYRSESGQTQVSKKWYAEYTFEGHKYYEPLKTSNKVAAIGAAFKIIDRIRRGEKRVRQRNAVLRDVIEKFLQSKIDRSRAPKTIEKYTTVCHRFRDHAEDNGCRLATSVSEDTFWAFNRVMVGEDLSDKTRHDRLTIIQSLFKWAAHPKRRFVASNPLEGVENKEPPPTEQPCFTPAQVGTLLQAADPHEGAIFAVLAYCGLRFGEARDLRWTDIISTPDGGLVLRIKRGGSGDSTKNGKHRQIVVHPEVARVLATVPRQFERVFTARPSKKHPKGGGPVSERRLLKSLKRLCVRCKFPDAESFKIHTFRHAFASSCVRNRLPNAFTLRWMGHSKSKILDLYVHMFDADAKEAMNTLSYPPPAASALPREVAGASESEPRHAAVPSPGA